MGQHRRYLSPGVRPHLLKQHAFAGVDWIRLLGGTLGAQSAHGAGTTVAAWVPTRKSAP
jgi:hypothetical protein